MMMLLALGNSIQEIEVTKLNSPSSQTKKGPSSDWFNLFIQVIIKSSSNQLELDDFSQLYIN